MKRELKILADYQNQARAIHKKSEEIQQVLSGIERSEEEMLQAEQALKSEHAEKTQARLRFGSAPEDGSGEFASTSAHLSR